MGLDYSWSSFMGLWVIFHNPWRGAKGYLFRDNLTMIYVFTPLIFTFWAGGIWHHQLLPNVYHLIRQCPSSTVVEWTITESPSLHVTTPAYEVAALSSTCNISTRHDHGALYLWIVSWNRIWQVLPLGGRGGSGATAMEGRLGDVFIHWRFDDKDLWKDRDRKEYGAGGGDGMWEDM